MPVDVAGEKYFTAKPPHCPIPQSPKLDDIEERIMEAREVRVRDEGDGEWNVMDWVGFEVVLLVDWGPDG